jgi:hypothetical protein
MPELRSDERRLIVELMIKIPELINGTKPTAATTSSEQDPTKSVDGPIVKEFR